MRRLDEMLPRTRYIHLTRHPPGHGESVIKYLEERKAMGPAPAEYWLLHLANFTTTELFEANLKRSPNQSTR
jgi:hypothetical protein